jgi:hypothetical protein
MPKDKDYVHVPYQLLDGAATSLAYGNKDYGEGKMRENCSANDRYNSCMGHLQSYRSGEQLDKESGLRHLDCAAMQLAFLMELEDTLCDELSRSMQDSGEYDDGKTDYWITSEYGKLEVWNIIPTWWTYRYKDGGVWLGSSDDVCYGLVFPEEWPPAAKSLDIPPYKTMVKVRL